MLLVIFGAGASFDSLSSIRPGHQDEYRPPLADGLFDNRDIFADARRTIEIIQPIVPLLQLRTSGLSVEQRLEELQAEGGRYKGRMKQLAGVRFYLNQIMWACVRHWRDRCRGVSNYKTLLDEIESFRAADETVGLVTFNYDVLLEDALPAVGVKIEGIDDYIRHPSYKLAKVHGSMNWGRLVASKVELHHKNTWDLMQELIDRTPELELTEDFVIVNNNPVTGFESGQVTLPALTIPILTKSKYEAPAAHVDWLLQALPRVSKVLIVGWRAGENYFLTRLSESLPHGVPILIVAGSDADAASIQTTMKSANIDARYEQFGNGFSEFITRRAVTKFLG